jgi:hypothetical protein
MCSKRSAIAFSCPSNRCVAFGRSTTLASSASASICSDKCSWLYSRHIEAGIPLVGLEPSCIAVFRDELLNLLPNNALAVRLSRQSFVLSEFLERSNTHLPRLEREGDRAGPLSPARGHRSGRRGARPETARAAVLIPRNRVLRDGRRLRLSQGVPIRRLHEMR